MTAPNKIECRSIFVANLLALAVLFACSVVAAGEPRPNVLLILADDMGFADLHINHPATGAPTPRLDQLAREGIRFTRHYADSTCSPARAALLTGRYPARIGFKPDAIGIPPELTTLPELFQAAGYRTHQIGKWHLGHLVREAWPDRQGFDTWFGYLNQWLTANNSSATGQFRYQAPTHVGAFLQNDRGEVRQYPGHLTDVLTERAAAIIDERADAPWFIYLAYSAPHTPIQPRADYAARFPDTPAGRYRAMLSQLDDRIGDLIDRVDSTGQRERTIVIFASDNGGTNAEVDSNAPFFGKKTEFLEGGLRTPLLIRWPGHLGAGTVIDTTVSIMDLYPTLATLTGLSTPADLDGKALFDGHRSPVSPPLHGALFWETDAGPYSSFGMLSADGRSRLYKSPFDAPVQYDLAADASGHKISTAPGNAPLVAFQRWHAHTSELDLTWQPGGSRGHGILTGDWLQRAAAFGDFTIGIAVVPSDITGARQALVTQAPTMAITTTPTGVHIQLWEFEFKLPPLETGRCTSLLLTGTFNRPISRLPTAPSSIEVYRDGQLVATQQQPTPLPPQPTNTPTFVGQNADGDGLFMGRLSPALYLNRRAGGELSPALSPSVLSRRLCADLTPP